MCLYSFNLTKFKPEIENNLNRKEFNWKRKFKLNGKFVDVPSHKVKPGDMIEIKDSSKDLIIIQHTIDTGQDNVIPSWLDVDNKKKSIKINAEPSRGDASSQIEEQLIVELYSK